MFEVHWVCSYQNQDNVHGTFNTLEEAQDSVRAWWKAHDFKPPYIRQWTKDNVTIWDYGSHTCFYHFVEIQTVEVQTQTKLKELRMHRLIESQRELAIEINKKYGSGTICYATISAIERNKANPRWKTILILSDFFGVTPQYLMGYDERRN